MSNTPTSSNADDPDIYLWSSGGKLWSKLNEFAIRYQHAENKAEALTYVNDMATAIQSNYLPKAKVLEAIGEDEQFTRDEADGKTEDMTINIAYYKKSTRNWLREQIKRKLGLESE